MLPTFVIIGAQKSASSFIQLCLAEHPNIYLPHGETPFFESPDYEQSNINQLKNIFQGRSEQCLGIKRPSYIGKPEVPVRIRENLPNSKLIAVLRNPIDRAVSAYFHNIKYGFVPSLDLETGMRKLILDSSFTSRYMRSPEIIEFGYYHKYLSKYRYYVENDQILILLHEEILSNSLSSIQRAYRFLGVSESFIPTSLSSCPQKVLYNLARLRLLSHRNRFIFHYNDDRTRLTSKKMTPIDKILARVITILDQRLLSKYLPNSKPKIGTELRNMLYGIYARDIEALEGFINRDLSAWKPYKEIV